MVVTDLEIHSRYARACSKSITPTALSEWARRKGVGLLSVGDITHPLWRREVRGAMVEREAGFYVLREESEDPAAPRFVLGGEVSLMFSAQGGPASGGRQDQMKGRRVHLLFLAPSFAAVEALVALINDKGKLASDGRVILSMSCRAFSQACRQADPNIMIIPAHIWTPWFGLLGSKSGFDSIEEAFEEEAAYIQAYETGLSADPAMCWRVDSLHRRVLISGSDLHSLPNMMREATLLQGQVGDYTYSRLLQAIRQPGHPDYYGTLEFYPQEGKYHADGHAACKVVLEPDQTVRLQGMCPVCGRGLMIGVKHRVHELANHTEGHRPPHAGQVIYAVPLQEIIAEAVGKKKSTKGVEALYLRMTSEIASEYDLLQNVQEFPDWVPDRVKEGIQKVRRGEVLITPGYDGIYGQVKLFSATSNKVSLWESGRG